MEHPLSYVRRLLPGVLVCLAVTLAALGLQALERRLVGQAYLEALVLAIVIGVVVRTSWDPPAVVRPGLEFSGRLLLEAAVVLLGAGISVRLVLALGPAVLLAIVGLVLIAVPASYGIGRAMGLSPKLAMLVACGNSICGNSAIAAVAPAIGADGDDIASSIAFTAVLGVIVVLLLPLLVPLLHLSLTQYGVLAGLTVYAVPQVLAATLPIGALSNQVGTVVKLVRVLMLGPVVLAVTLIMGRGPDGAQDRTGVPAASRPKLHQMIPWFITGFLVLAAMRSAGLIPTQALAPIRLSANAMTTISMAALGLMVDVRVVARAGLRVVAAVTVSLLVLGALGLGLIKALAIA